MGKQRIVLEFDFDRSPLSARVVADGEDVAHGNEAVERLSDVLRAMGLSVEVSHGKVWDTTLMTIEIGDE